MHAPSSHDLAAELAAHGIRPTQQRILILGYLRTHLVHPTVERIHSDLKSKHPTLSKATVYNTLESLREAGLVRLLTLDGLENRYDVHLEPHGHFRCVRCGGIRNFTFHIGEALPEALRGFRISDRDVYFQGVCKDCLDKENGFPKE